jgi:DNA/RNA endonuclease YhcR with UshA esterase domain
MTLGARLSWVLISVLLTFPFAQAQKTLTATEAKNHIGETATVCGEVASTHYATSSRGKPTFINLDKPYPNEIFTVLIWGSDRPKFANSEPNYGNKRVCVTGNVTDYKGVPEIVAREPSQIKIQ